MIKYWLMVILSVCCQQVWAEKDREEAASGWVEEKINPSTEWLEGVVTPVTRWMERNIQDPEVHRGEVVSGATQPQNIPSGLIDAAEAGRLLLLLYPGDILRIELLATQPYAYAVKLLSASGSISTFYLNATDGTLLDQRPPLAVDNNDSASGSVNSSRSSRPGPRSDLSAPSADAKP